MRIPEFPTSTEDPMRMPPIRWIGNAFATAVLIAVSACSSPTGQPVFDVPPDRADDLLVVDCLLPGRVRQLGSQLTYLEPPRPAKVSAVECEIRGGEYTSFDRANFATSLKIWLPKAKEGDAQAQNYVGEIFEKGLGVTPDYAAAREWYAKAAEQGYAPAQINLGQLYEKGLGVEADTLTAMNWYRKASGLEELQMAYVPSPEAKAELEGLRSNLSQQTETVTRLRKQLDARDEELAGLREQRQTRRREIEAEKESLAASRRQLDAAADELHADQARIQTESKKLAAQRREFEKQLDESSDDEDIVAAGKRQLERATAMLSSLYSALTSRESALDERDGDIAARSRQQSEDMEREGKALAEARAKLAADRKALEDARKRQQAGADKLELERSLLAQQRDQASASAEAIAEARSKLDRTASQLAITAAAHKRREATLEKRQREIEEREAAQGKIEDERLALANARKALTAEREKLKQDRLALETESKALERNRAQLEVKSNETSSTEQKLAAARAQLERMSALAALQAEAQKSQKQLLAQREEDIAEREAAFGRRQSEMERLEQQIADLKTEAAQQRTDVVMLAQNNPVDLPGPTIQLIDPLIPVTRGLKITMAIPPASKRVLVGRVEAPAGLVSLTINDREVEPDKKGIFRTEVTLAEGETPVTVVAIDRDGRRGDREFVLEASEGTRGTQHKTAVRKPKVDFGSYYALVIGNNEYSHLPRLETAVQDATAIGHVLEDRYGFEVTTLTNATRYQILSALNKLRSQLTEDDNLLIYYAGHGELDKVNMRGHWLPVDAEPTSTANWISNIALTDILNTMNARHVMVVADSCYSGALTRSALARLEAGLTEEARQAWQRAMAQKRSRTALTSGGLAPVLDAGGGDHSIFAKALIDILSANAGVLEGQRLFQELSAQVTWAAEAKNFEQVPQYAPIKFAGHESGDFFFVPKG